MRPLSMLGALLYYLGLFAMFWGFISLFMGITSTVTAAMNEVKSAAAEPSALAKNSSCPSPPCISETAPVPQNEAEGMVFSAQGWADSQVDGFFQAIGLSELGGDSTTSLFYSKIRRFFGFFGIGLAMVVIGTLLRLSDSLAKYIGDHGRKQPIAEKDRVREGAGRPEKNWTKYIEKG